MSAPQPLPPQPLPPQPAARVLVPAKSPGVAVLLTFLLLGAGHLYVNKVGAGVALIVFDLFLLLISLSVFGLIVSVPVWFVAFAIAATTSASAASRWNASAGLHP